MARTIDEAAHARRRNEFLDSAQRLLELKGYERMTIQDVLDDLETSRGALYHYFDSKEALLEGVVERLTEAATSHLVATVDDSDLPALERLHLVFKVMASWKGERRMLLVATLPVWLARENAVFRETMRARMRVSLTPLLSRIIGQGAEEGVFRVSEPDLMARVVVGLLQDLNEAVMEMLLAVRAGEVREPAVAQMVLGYTEAVERVLGARPGSVELFDPMKIPLWVDALRAGSPAKEEEEEVLT